MYPYTLCTAKQGRPDAYAHKYVAYAQHKAHISMLWLYITIVYTPKCWW